MFNVYVTIYSLFYKSLNSFNYPVSSSCKSKYVGDKMRFLRLCLNKKNMIRLILQLSTTFPKHPTSSEI